MEKLEYIKSNIPPEQLKDAQHWANLISDLVLDSIFEKQIENKMISLKEKNNYHENRKRC